MQTNTWPAAIPKRRFKDMLLTTSRFLRWVLLADAATCVLTGLLMIFGSVVLEGLFGLPAGLLRNSGLSLLPFAALLLYLASRECVTSRTVWLLIVLNALWTADSFLLFLTGWFSPTEL